MTDGCDPEAALYKDVAQTKREITSLKTKLTKLSRRTEAIESMAFQEQISSLDGKIQNVEQHIIAISRAVSISIIEFNQLHLLHSISNNLVAAQRERPQQLVNFEATRATEEVSKSDAPLTIASKFRGYCVNLSKEYSLGAYLS